MKFIRDLSRIIAIAFSPVQSEEKHYNSKYRIRELKRAMAKAKRNRNNEREG